MGWSGPPLRSRCRDVGVGVGSFEFILPFQLNGSADGAGGRGARPRASEQALPILLDLDIGPCNEPRHENPGLQHRNRPYTFRNPDISNLMARGLRVGPSSGWLSRRLSGT